MANPNRTVAAFVARANNPRAMFVVREERTRDSAKAESMAEEWRATGEFDRVVVASVRCGKRGDRTKQWFEHYVRAYSKGN